MSISRSLKWHSKHRDSPDRTHLGFSSATVLSRSNRIHRLASYPAGKRTEEMRLQVLTRKPIPAPERSTRLTERITPQRGTSMAQTQNPTGTIAAYFDDSSDARQAVEALKDAGFLSAHIGVAHRGQFGTTSTQSTTGTS